MISRALDFYAKLSTAVAPSYAWLEISDGGPHIRMCVFPAHTAFKLFPQRHVRCVYHRTSHLLCSWVRCYYYCFEREIRLAAYRSVYHTLHCCQYKVAWHGRFDKFRRALLFCRESGWLCGSTSLVATLTQEQILSNILTSVICTFNSLCWKDPTLYQQTNLGIIEILTWTLNKEPLAFKGISRTVLHSWSIFPLNS